MAGNWVTAVAVGVLCLGLFALAVVILCWAMRSRPRGEVRTITHITHITGDPLSPQGATAHYGDGGTHRPSNDGSHCLGCGGRWRCKPVQASCAAAGYDAYAWLDGGASRSVTETGEQR